MEVMSKEARSGPLPMGRQEHVVYRGKRALDLAIAVPAIVLSVPVQVVTGVLVAVKLGRPIVFRQERPGLHGKVFTLYKFRSMRPEVYPGQGDGERLTPFGKALRSTSLDELPSLWNVIKGDMSLVGPRPLLTSYLDLYTASQAQRHLVRPGLTGLAQISGRNQLDWASRLDLDVWYVENCSVGLDIRILARTVLRTVRRDGITPAGSDVMPRFTGTECRDGASK